MPARGQVYSLNDARYFDWPEGLRKYIDTIRQGKGQNAKQYSARYICSLGEWARMGMCSRILRVEGAAWLTPPHKTPSLGPGLCASVVGCPRLAKTRGSPPSLGPLSPLLANATPPPHPACRCPCHPPCTVADFHRTLLEGGWAANPRPHLRLVYEGNPLAMLAEQVRG
jgi:hypothetical protein